MDPYNLLQEQIANISNNIQNSIQKLSDEVSQISRRVDQIEQQTRRTKNLSDKLDSVQSRVESIPKIYNNQISLLDTLLTGHKYQYKRIAELLARDLEHNPFAGDANLSTITPANTQNNTVISGAAASGAHHDDDDDDDDDDDAAMTNVNGHHQQQQHHQQQHNHMIAQSQRVNNTLQPQPPAQTQPPRIAPQNRVNQSPVNMGLMSQDQGSRQAVPQTQQQNTPSSVPRLAFISDLSQDQMSLPNLQGSNDDMPGLNDVVEDEARRMWDNVPFTSLNPQPKSVQEVLDEYHYGYKNQPPLAYLEKYRKDWRKTNKNLSKTFCRRYRIVTAVETGMRQYMRDYGITENVARERIINELESMRIKANGKKETMYWLFHHIPTHLKRR